jgi:hypothetical protein
MPFFNPKSKICGLAALSYQFSLFSPVATNGFSSIVLAQTS